MDSVVVIGAGFAGLKLVRKLAKSGLNIKLIDKNNYHTFYPLLYQVSAAELTSEQIAIPVRSMLRKYQNVEFIMGEVTDINSDEEIVQLNGDTSINYDYLVVATGTEPFYFGTEGAEEYCFTIDSLVNGEKLRNRVLKQFEKADKLEDEDAIRKELKFAIIGAGPTGVEYATALSELVYGPLKKDFPKINMDLVDIEIIEAMDQVLPMLNSSNMSNNTTKQLEKRNINVRTGAMVEKIDESKIYLSSGDIISATTKIWTAGVQASPMFEKWSLPTTKRNLLPVNKFLQIKDQDNIFAIGDVAHFEDEEGKSLPKLAPVAIQMGEHLSKNIKLLYKGVKPKAFKYKNKGELVVLGRFDAVARVWGREFSGFLAWLLWGMVHIFNLIGFRNRLFVLINWLWDLMRFEKVERLIIE